MKVLLLLEGLQVGLRVGLRVGLVGAEQLSGLELGGLELDGLQLGGLELVCLALVFGALHVDVQLRIQFAVLLGVHLSLVHLGCLLLGPGCALFGALFLEVVLDGAHLLGTLHGAELLGELDLELLDAGRLGAFLERLGAFLKRLGACLVACCCCCCCWCGKAGAARAFLFGVLLLST